MSDTLFESYDDRETAISYRTSHWGAQSFTPQITHNITSVKLRCYQTDATSLGATLLSIKAVDGDGKPTGDDLALKSLTKDFGTTPGALHEWVFDTFAVGGACLLVASEQYVIVLRAPNTPVNKSILVGRRYTSPAYAGGVMIDSTNSGAAWTLLAQDMTFFEYGLVPAKGGQGSPALLIAQGII